MVGGAVISVPPVYQRSRDEVEGSRKSKGRTGVCPKARVVIEGRV